MVVDVRRRAITRSSIWTNGWDFIDFAVRYCFLLMISPDMILDIPSFFTPVSVLLSLLIITIQITGIL